MKRYLSLVQDQPNPSQRGLAQAHLGLAQVAENKGMRPPRKHGCKKLTTLILCCKRKADGLNRWLARANWVRLAA